MSNRVHVASSAIKKKQKHSRRLTEGLRFKKSRGQHILKNAAILDAIVSKAGIKSTDIVLEIGPGTGNLTIRLLNVAKKVIGIELDDRLILELKRRVQQTEGETKLQIIHGDVLKTDLPYFDVCVANIPYNISSPLIFKLLAHRPVFRSATLLLQREFAMRMIAQAEESLFCRLALNTQLLARVSHLMKIGRSNFVPPPKVDSSLVRIEPRSPLPPINFIEWDNLVKICFCRKNKTLRAAFTRPKLLKKLEDDYKSFHALQLGTDKHSEATDKDLSPMFEGMGLELTKSREVTASSDDDDSDVSMADGSDHGDFKALVVSVLTQLNFNSRRPAKMPQTEFMALLAGFNAEGIHFV